MIKLVKKSLCLLVLCAFFLNATVFNCFAAFTIGDEREAGEKLLYSVRSSFELLDDPDLTQYITGLGYKVLDVAGIQYFDYHFFIINDTEFNAFAAPSGLIFFYSGLIATMNSEEELLSVLAHEVGHIVKRHLASRIEKGTYTSIGSLGLALAAVAFGGALTPVLLTGALATGQSLNLHYSRQHEEEADLMAYDWMKKLHSNPEGQAKMLETMRRIARYRSDQLPQYLLTHPNPEARLDYIESLMDIDNRTQLEQTSRPGDEFAFLRFKYRVMSQVKETGQFRAALAARIADPRATELERSMAWYGMSQIDLRENNGQRGLEHLQKVIEQFPDRLILKVDKANLLISAGEFAAAEQQLRDVLKTDGQEMFATYLLAQLLLQSRRFEEAEQYFLTVSYHFPEYAKVYFQLGQIAASRNQYGLSRFYLGKYQLYQGKLKEAVHSFREASVDKDLAVDKKQESKALIDKIRKLEK